LEEMVRIITHLHATPDEVFRLLANAWLYPEWVVGTREVLAVDPKFPARGTRFRHRVGAGPVTTDDETRVLACDAPRLLVLRVQAGPLGDATVKFELHPEDDGARLTFTEVPEAGPILAARLPGLARILELRNRETVARLRRLVELPLPEASGLGHPGA
jgi:uncharacterized protein YndB with AHSA1/START domain